MSDTHVLRAAALTFDGLHHVAEQPKASRTEKGADNRYGVIIQSESNNLA